MVTVKDIWGDVVVRRCIMWGFGIGSILIFPYICVNYQTYDKIIWTFLKEVGFAILVSLPILFTIELFNQRRHAKAERNLLREQAIALVKQNVPNSIWSVVESSIIEHCFYREAFVVSYVLTLNRKKDGLEYVEVKININYKVVKARPTKTLYPIKPCIALTDESRERAKFTKAVIGARNYTEQELKGMSTEVNKNLIVTGIDDQDIRLGESLTVSLEIETAFSLNNPFEAFVMSDPAIDLTVNVSAPQELSLYLDTLHPEDMKPLKDKDGEYTWVQPRGLVSGQGCIIRWEKGVAQVI